jgi:hypothetical protein
MKYFSIFEPIRARLASKLAKNTYFSQNKIQYGYRNTQLDTNFESVEKWQQS